jgi:hypothetical protein
MPLNLYEQVADLSPGQGGFNVRTGRWTRLWFLKTPDPAVLASTVKSILGYTTYAASTDGRLVRSVPLADPQFPWLYASNIPAIQGTGMRDVADPSVFFEEYPSDFPRPAELIEPTYSKYPWWVITVESEPRPFVVVPDSAITVTVGNWFNFAGTSQDFNYVDEWTRFADWTSEVTPEAVSGQLGNMQFRSMGQADGRNFASRPRMFLPNATLSVVWFGVPYRYLISPNSYIAGHDPSPARGKGGRPWFGCINQNAVTWFGQTFPVGSLLYLNYKVSTRYPAAIDNLVPYGGLTGGAYGVEKFVDITLNFMTTWRTAPPGDLPADSGGPNFVMAGWNLQPWLRDRRFHYATSNPLETQRPSHYSFPAELLFMDPDFEQPGGIFNEGV